MITTSQSATCSSSLRMCDETSTAIQLARWAGARVISTVSKDQKAELVYADGRRLIGNHAWL